MAILVDEHSAVIVCGIADPLARFQCEEMRRHGTNLAGIIGSPEEMSCWLPPADVPIFAGVATAASAANVALVFNLALECRAIIETLIDVRIPLIVCLTEHVPVHDAMRIRVLAKRAGVVLIGPNSSGLLSPGRAKAGFFVEDICLPGKVGLASKSGSLAYAVMAELQSAGIGISTVVAIGGDSAKGTDFSDCLALFEADPETEAIVMLGEIGGGDEERAAAHVSSRTIKKPVIALISGRSVPPGYSMGHAGAIARLGRGDYAEKRKALSDAGIRVVDNIGAIVEAIAMVSA